MDFKYSNEKANFYSQYICLLTQLSTAVYLLLR